MLSYLKIEIQMYLESNKAEGMIMPYRIDSNQAISIPIMFCSTSIIETEDKPFVFVQHFLESNGLSA